MNLQPILQTLSVLIPIIVTCYAAWLKWIKENTKQKEIEADKEKMVARENSAGAIAIAKLQADVVEIYKWKDKITPEHESIKKELDRLIDNFNEHLQEEINRYHRQFK